MKKFIITILLASLIGGLAGSGITFAFFYFNKTTKNQLMRDFYLTENAVYESPHSIRKKMDKGDKSFTLVDVRSPQEYEKEHIIGAINIPAYKDPNTSVSLETENTEKERIINSFKNLSKEKDIVVYCYSVPCMTGRKIGNLLADNNVFVKHLGIGWNEWRYFWNLWNHDSETQTRTEDYIISGKEPGTPKIIEIPTSCGEGELSC